MDYGITSCPITLDDFKNGEEIICLPCKHIFNPDAIKNWILSKRIKSIILICGFLRNKEAKDILFILVWFLSESILILYIVIT